MRVSVRCWLSWEVVIRRYVARVTLVQWLASFLVWVGYCKVGV